MTRKGGKIMDKNEQKLSDYIDHLNLEQKPQEHEYPPDSSELEELFQTVRQVRSLKEPAMPGTDFQKKLARSLMNSPSQGGSGKTKKRSWFNTIASLAAILVIAVFVNFILPFDRNNFVYAMEEAFRGVKAYHGILEIVQTNAEGESTSQGELEVWANQEGYYFIKGLEGSLAGLITVNNGEKKWQVRPDQKEVHLFPAFPDAYRFTFELGREIEDIKNALSSKVIGEELVAGRKTSIIEVTPQGGIPYRIWVDQETKLPLQKETGMQNAIQYRITYSEIKFNNTIPKELLVYHLPVGYTEIDLNPEQLVTDLTEVQQVVGFTPKTFENIPVGYIQDQIAIVPDMQLTKLYYTTNYNTKIIVIQGNAVNEFKPVSSAVLGKINNNIVEIQSPVYEDLGVLGGGGLYSGVTNISAIRWQQDGFEYAVVGNAPLDEMVSFTEHFANGILEIPALTEEFLTQPQVEVPINLIAEENDQKSVDAGSSPWKLDPVFVAQVFVSLEMSPEGITGEYPIQSENLKVFQNTGNHAIVTVSGDATPISKVYLQRLIRQDSTGIWTVVGYDPLQ